MDLYVKQWGKQHESEAEEQQSAKMPKLVLQPHQKPQPSALPLFVHEPYTKVSTLSAFSDSTLPTPRFPRMGSYFSLAQWQELELQALIFRYMLAGAAVPPELLHSVKKSLLHSPPYFLPHYPLYNDPACIFKDSVLILGCFFVGAALQSAYWGRVAMDPEPGRCRRTDGKKWRCSRDVVAGQKYCERHMHRGRNRSRKPVELPTATGGSGGGGGRLGATTSINTPSLATGSLKSPFDVLHLDRSSSGTKNQHKGLFGIQDDMCGDGRSDGHTLRRFFDDWPRSVEESYNGESNASCTNSTTCLSISEPGIGSTSSDVSLKLFTGNGENPCSRNGNVGREQAQLNWGGGWNSANVGGPLAEVLRSSSSTSTPHTLVVRQMPRASTSDSSFITS
ncbi:growth-regulating factor 3 [Senna tora]|uniref:Growth-regulating factor n=1 Tax=Senna tora TaxID=362788 RepID=A0A834SIS4_9FABA|nr:growth-regulating factor 3 [Senna tora]